MKLKHTLVFQHGSLGLAPVWMLKKRGKRPSKLARKHHRDALGCQVYAQSKSYLLPCHGGKAGG